MNFLVHFRVFAVILLATFAILVVGCAVSGGPASAKSIGSGVTKAIFGETLSVYKPVNASRSNLQSAKTECNAYAIQKIAPLRTAAQVAENQRYQAATAAAAQQCSACLAAAASSGAAAAALQQQTCRLTACQNPSRHAVNSFDNERRQFFCSCMTQEGWNCAGTLKFRDVNAPIPQADRGQTPLHIVALNDNADSVSWLVSKGADVNVKDSADGTPLHWTTFEDAVRAATALLNNGADIDARTNGGGTPLHAAAVNGSDKIAALLIKSGANVNAISTDDWTPLHTAARSNSRKVAGLLISEGADVDTQGGDDGMTPLHRAAFYGNEAIVDLLIARGANPNAKTYADETPLDIAKREGKRDVVALLERAARAAVRKADSADESGPADGGDSAESVFENVWRSVVVVIAGDSQGGGVVVNEPNQVATNCHVVDESPNDIRVYKGANRRAVRDAPHSAEIVSGDRERDVCILFVSGLWAIPAKIRPVAELEIGEAVYAVGTPKGLDFSISNGIVSQLRKEEGENAPLIQTSAAISPGSSGGGLFDSKGRLVGLTTWKIREGENLNFAVPVDWALELR